MHIQMLHNFSIENDFDVKVELLNFDQLHLILITNRFLLFTVHFLAMDNTA